MSITITRGGPSELLPLLAEFERKHGMSTSDFLERWMRGELDSHEYVRWLGLCQMAIRAGLIAKPHANQLAAAV